MKTKEKIERAGFTHRVEFAGFEIYGKNNIRLLYDPMTDDIYAYYDITDCQLKYVDDDTLEILTER